MAVNFSTPILVLGKDMRKSDIIQYQLKSLYKPKSFVRVSIALSLLANLVGCATKQSSHTQPVKIEVPASWSVETSTRQTGRTTSLVEWWHQFDDPILVELITASLDANTSILQAKAAINQAVALRDVSFASLVPSLTASGTGRRDTQGLADNNRSSTQSYSLGVDGSWVLDVYGGRESAVAARDAEIWVQTADLGDVQVQVVAELARDYITLRNNQTRLSIAYATLQAQEQTLQIARWRKQAGVGSMVEVEQARSAVEQTRATLPQLQTNIEVAQHAIAILTGKAPAALNTVLRAPRSVPRSGLVLEIAIPSETLRQRADVRAAEYEILKSLGQIGQAYAETKPSFTLSGSLSLSSAKLSTLLNGSSVLSSLFGTVNLPVFDGGAAKAQLTSEEAGLERTQQSYRATVLSALRDVEDALVKVRDDIPNLEALRNAADSAARAAALASLRYRTGFVDFQTVLEAQRTELSTKDNLANATATASTNQVSLYKALGGGWSAPATLPVATRAEVSSQ
jgi:outer membrane protein, multidrug efflux system